MVLKCLAARGIHTVCIDVDAAKIDRLRGGAAVIGADEISAAVHSEGPVVPTLGVPGEKVRT